MATPNGSKKGGPQFVTRILHKASGKILKAEDYGIKAFPIGRRR